MKSKLCLICLLSFMLLISGLASSENKHNFQPENGYVPSKEIAIKIALAVWEPVYERKNIENQAPYNVVLEKGVWVVTGSLPDGWVGGVALIEIDKKTGKIIRMSHGQ